jgi:hypothetical protein
MDAVIVVTVTRHVCVCVCVFLYTLFFVSWADNTTHNTTLQTNTVNGCCSYGYNAILVIVGVVTLSGSDGGVTQDDGYGHPG